MQIGWLSNVFLRTGISSAERWRPAPHDDDDDDDDEEEDDDDKKSLKMQMGKWN